MLAELVAGLILGDFIARERAEVALFLAFRPWLLLLLCAMVARGRTRWRLWTYVLGLAAAGATESVLAWQLGAPRPWSAALRGAGAGLVLAAVLDLVVQTVRRWGGIWAGLVAGAGLLLVPGGAVAAFERAAIRAERGAGGQRPEVTLLTGLPLVWGAGGAGGVLAGNGPAVAYLALRQEFDLRTRDRLGPMRGVLLMVQPKAMTAAELVMLDQWVRSGGRLLILEDRRYLEVPADTGLGPLLAHWGVIRAAEAGARVRQFDDGAGVRRLVTVDADRLSAPGCASLAAGVALDCRIGRGRAIMVGDADLVDAIHWAPVGAGRLTRLADNALLLQEWLDRLAGVRRSRADSTVAWRTVAEPEMAVAFALIVPAGLLGAGATLRRK